MAIHDKPNNFATNKPVVIIYVDANDEPEAMETDDKSGEIMVFDNLSKAQKYVQRRIVESEHKNIRFANEVPVMGAGDRQETNNRKCLKCKGFLRLGNQFKQRVEGVGDLACVEYLCPKCDLGEK